MLSPYHARAAIARRAIVIIIIMVIPTAPRIPPHHPSQRDRGIGVVSLVGYLLGLFSCLVAKVFNVLSCPLAE